MGQCDQHTDVGLENQGKMKIGIITFHFVYNCGAQLQCLALSEKLKSMGHEVCVINYQPWYHKNRYTAIKNPVYYGKKMAADRGDGAGVLKRGARGAKGFLVTVYSYRNYFSVKERAKLFGDFERTYLNETKVYRTLKELKKDPPVCDLYISGSDQLWNAKLTEGKLDNAYLLDFGSSDIKRITYAMGVNFSNMTTTEEELKEKLSNFSAISLREAEYLEDIERLTEGKVRTRVDLDPTFLLEAQDYDRFIPKETLEKDRYIVTYTMPDTSQKLIYQAAAKLSEKTGLKVIDVCGNPTLANRRMPDNRVVGPTQFLWYMKNADYVLTNSFHGTAFSVNLNKNFAVIPHSLTGYRVTELLERAGLRERAVTEPDQTLPLFDREPDFNTANEKLSQYREESVGFLMKETGLK